MTLHPTMLSSTEPKNVGSKSTLLLWLFCFRGRVGGCYWFRMKEHLNLLTYLITNLSSFLFDSTCSVADSGTVFSVYNDRDVR